MVSPPRCTLFLSAFSVRDLNRTAGFATHGLFLRAETGRKIWGLVALLGRELAIQRAVAGPQMNKLLAKQDSDFSRDFFFKKEFSSFF